MTEMQSHVCGECGIEWAQPKKFTDARREDKRTFYCPNGHPRAFVESEADRLRRERDRLKQETARLHDGLRWANDRADREARRVSAAKGQITRLKNRAAAGVCPCCSRTFSNLQRHMQTKHAGFVAEEIVLPEGAALQ